LAATRWLGALVPAVYRRGPWAQTRTESCRSVRSGRSLGSGRSCRLGGCIPWFLIRHHSAAPGGCPWRPPL